MQDLIRAGRKKTILITISILLVSLHTIYYYHAVRPEMDTNKLIQQLISFALTIGLLIFVYLGKKWAKNIAIALFVLSTVGAIVGLFTMESESIVNKVPLMVMVIVYSMAIHQFSFSKSFKAFYEHQNDTSNEIQV